MCHTLTRLTHLLRKACHMEQARKMARQPSKAGLSTSLSLSIDLVEHGWHRHAATPSLSLHQRFLCSEATQLSMYTLPMHAHACMAATSREVYEGKA